MIFLSVGTQAPFDRLIEAVDAWAAISGQDIFGQLGALTPQSYRPKNFEWSEFLSAADYADKLQQADILVAHVGMGSIISALSNAKPLVMLARRASLGEHRNEHQLATVERFRGRAGLYFADEAEEVGPLIEQLLAREGGAQSAALSPFADESLIAAVRDFIHQKG